MRVRPSPRRGSLKAAMTRTTTMRFLRWLDAVVTENLYVHGRHLAHGHKHRRGAAHRSPGALHALRLIGGGR